MQKLGPLAYSDVGRQRKCMHYGTVFEVREIDFGVYVWLPIDIIKS